jgi:hypothetical protein
MPTQLPPPFWRLRGQEYAANDMAVSQNNVISLSIERAAILAARGFENERHPRMAIIEKRL